MLATIVYTACWPCHCPKVPLTSVVMAPYSLHIFSVHQHGFRGHSVTHGCAQVVLSSYLQLALGNQRTSASSLAVKRDGIYLFAVNYSFERIRETSGRCRGTLSTLPIVPYILMLASCTSQGPVKMLGAEAKSQPAFGADKPLSAHGYNLHKDGKHQRAYRLTLAPGAQTGVHRCSCPSLHIPVFAGSMSLHMPVFAHACLWWEHVFAHARPCWEHVD